MTNRRFANYLRWLIVIFIFPIIWSYMCIVSETKAFFINVCKPFPEITPTYLIVMGVIFLTIIFLVILIRRLDPKSINKYQNWYYKNHFYGNDFKLTGIFIAKGYGKMARDVWKDVKRNPKEQLKPRKLILNIAVGIIVIVLLVRIILQIKDFF